MAIGKKTIDPGRSQFGLTVDPIGEALHRIFDSAGDLDGGVGGIRFARTEGGLLVAFFARRRLSRFETSRVVTLGQVAAEGGEVAKDAFAVNIFADSPEGLKWDRHACRQYLIDTAGRTATEQGVEWTPRTLSLEPWYTPGGHVRQQIGEAIEAVTTAGPDYDPTRGNAAFEVFSAMAMRHAIDPGLVVAVERMRAGVSV